MVFRIQKSLRDRHFEVLKLDCLDIRKLNRDGVDGKRTSGGCSSVCPPCRLSVHANFQFAIRTYLYYPPFCVLEVHLPAFCCQSCGTSDFSQMVQSQNSGSLQFELCAHDLFDISVLWLLRL